MIWNAGKCHGMAMLECQECWNAGMPGMPECQWNAGMPGMPSECHGMPECQNAV